ncbi:MAG: GNAT family N-acetyltransferase, partial [Steroidobacteraceae bacterium]
SRQVQKCFRVFAFLRPHVTNSEFIRRVRMQTHEAYKIAQIELEGEVVAAAGFRVINFLAWGKVLYIDDLITYREKQRVGLGGALMDWLLDEGNRLGCDEAHLDTGFQRHDAHRLYLNKGFDLSCHDLARKLT